MSVLGGHVTLDVLTMSAFGLFGCLLGDFLGKGVFDKLDANMLKKIIYIGMTVSGIIMII